jgi:hypothetical protein
MKPLLRLAAESLQGRLKAVQAPLTDSQTPAASWKSMMEAYQGGFPSDYVEMMAEFPFDDVVLTYMCMNQAREYPENIDVNFRFRGATTFYGTVFSEGFDRALLSMGLAAIGEGEDGDFWVVNTSDGVDGPVYYVEHTAWDGGRLHFNNGLTFAAPNLARLIAGFSLSSYGYAFDWRTEKQELDFDLKLFWPYPEDDEVYDVTPTA